MKSKKIVRICTTIILIGLACLIGYVLIADNQSSGIELSVDSEERVNEISGIQESITQPKNLKKSKGEIIKSKSKNMSDDNSNSDNFMGESNETTVSKEVGNNSKVDAVEKPEMIAVHVCGQVKNPGVYSLAKGARVNEAINAAGGLTKKAAGDSINQAQILKDEQQVYVPDKKEAKKIKVEQPVDKENENHSVENSLININQATIEELMTLPGIGKAKADMIITYREEHGRFATIEEIKNISGIKDGVYNKICDLIKTD